MERVAFCIIFAILSNYSLAQETTRFETEIPDSPRPWMHEGFDTGEDRFTFAVFSDLEGGNRSRVFDVAIAQLSLLKPELILNVGDLIAGPSDNPEELHALWDSFDERTAKAQAPVFYVGGNHDFGNDSDSGEVSQRVWAERYGPTYYSFKYKDVLFLVINTQDGAPTAERSQELAPMQQETRRLISEGAQISDAPFFYTHEMRGGFISDDQTDYFLNAISDNQDVRWTFLFMHKAPWEEGGDENFSAIEDALASRPYTVFHGHEHSYQYLERKGRDYIRLATTGGGQPLSYHKSTISDRVEGRSVDQVALVTVDNSGVDIANLLLSGILDKTGHIPLKGDDVCFELSICGSND